MLVDFAENKKRGKMVIIIETKGGKKSCQCRNGDGR